MANKMTVKGWDEIQSDYERMQGMSCVPAVIRKVAQNHVFDENQSVKWNRDKVAENNAAYQAEVARLNTAKNKARDAIHEDIYRAIQSEVGHGLTRDGARKLWEYAYDKGHAHGSYAIISYLEDLLVLVYGGAGRCQTITNSTVPSCWLLRQSPILRGGCVARITALGGWRTNRNVQSQ